MLLSILISLIAFSLILIIGGYFIEVPVMQIAGTGVLFLAGLLLMFSTIEYKTGEYYVYGSNFSLSNGTPTYHWDYGDPPEYLPNDKTSLLFHAVDEFSTWDEEILQGIQTKHTIAVLLLISAILIFVSVFAHLREGGDLSDE